MGSPAVSSPVTGYDATLKATLVYEGTTSGYLEALNAQNGAIVWSDSLGVPILGSPTVYQHDLWVGTYVSGRLYKVDALTGVVLCQLSLGTGTDLSSPTVATPPGGRAAVFLGVQDNGIESGPIMAINESTCKVEWSVIPYAQESGSWNPTSFAVDATGEPLVLAGSANPDSTVYALDARTGATVWSNRNLHPQSDDVGAGITLSPHGANGLADGRAYYPGLDGILYAIDLTTGATEWTFNFAAATTPSAYNGGRSAAALSGTSLVFGTGTGVMAVDAVRGTEIWDSAKTVGPDTEIISSPLIAGPPGQQVVVYGDMNGSVRVLRLSDGSLLYSFPTHGYIMASPADSGGRIVIPSSDGFLYSFGIGGVNAPVYPRTTITRPTDGSTLKNPNSATSTTALVPLAGTAVTTGPSPHALVAVQADGGTGPWWNSALSKWQPGLAWNRVYVSSAGQWNLRVPVGRAGAVWQVLARAQDQSGVVDPQGANAATTILPVASGPRLALPVTWGSPTARLNVSGQGFGAEETVQLSLPGVVLANVTTGSSGAFATTLIQLPPRFPYGLTALTAVGEHSGLEATAGVYVTSPWTQLGENPARTSALPNDVVLSSEEVPDKIYRMVPSFVLDSGAPIASSPAVANKVAYFGTTTGLVEAVSTDTGRLAWEATTSGAVNSSPYLDLAGGRLVVGSSDGYVYAFDLSTGGLLWKTATGGAVVSSPTEVNGTVYVGSDDGRLYALAGSSGGVLWTASMGAAVVASPVVDSSRGVVVIGDTSGHIAAFFTGGTAPGSEAWSRQLSAAVDGAPILSRGLLYVGSAAGEEYALTESTGATQWAVSLHGAPSATSALQGGVLFVGSGNGDLYAIAPSNGSVLWTYHTAGPVTGVSATDDLVFTESSQGTLNGFRVSGDNVWLAEAGPTLYGTAAVSDNAVIVGAGDGGLYVFTPYGLPMQ